MTMKLIAILLTIFGSHSCGAQLFNRNLSLINNFQLAFNDLKIPANFDPFNVKNFTGFDGQQFDGLVYNPFSFNIENITDRYAKKFNRNYTSEERAERQKNLIKSLQVIAEHVIKSFVSGTTFNVGLTSLSDRTDEEFRQLLGTRVAAPQTVIRVQQSSRKKRASTDPNCQPRSNTSLPVSLDWRQQNIVTPVKSQSANCTKVLVNRYQVGTKIYSQYQDVCNNCGACWAFASLATIESQWAKSTGELIDLSEQDLVNCASANGCNGNTLDAPYKYVVDNGAARESASVYIAKVGVCTHYPLTGGVQISSYCRKGGTSRYLAVDASGAVVKEWYETEDNPDEKIMRDIRDIGPVAASMNSDDLNVRQYTSGVYDYKDCSNATNHAVTIVGWGAEGGVGYWIVKNSWGQTWGESGYLRVVRGKSMCGINSVYYFPILTNAKPVNKMN